MAGPRTVRLDILERDLLPDFVDAVQERGSFDLAELGVHELLRRRPWIRRMLGGGVSERELFSYLCRFTLRRVGSLFALAQHAERPEFADVERIEVDAAWPYGSELAFLRDVALRERPETLRPGLVAGLERLHFGEARVKITLRAIRELVSLWRVWLSRLSLRTGTPGSRPLLIRSFATDWGLDAGGQRRLRNLDFLVDGTTIRADEVAVWAEQGLSAPVRAELAARGYAALEPDDVALTAAGFVRALPILGRASLTLLRLARAEQLWQEPLARLFSERVLWREVARRGRPRVFVMYNDVHPSGVARTIALRALGCTTVLYEHASSWAFDENGFVPDFVNAFMVADAIHTWGPAHTEVYSRDRGEVGALWEDGCLWSEQARLVRDDPAVGDDYRRDLERSCGVELGRWQSVVAVFDTSVTPLLLRHEDLAAFYAGVARLAARRPETLFLVKPKNPLDEVFGEPVLHETPNLRILETLFETAAVIASCDASVNACYTSPAIETIGVGKPALYYDPTDRFPSAFFRRIPDFVATSDDDLADMLGRALGSPPSAETLARFARLEGHFDGLAITRLRLRIRALLDGGEAARPTLD